jgi:transposase
MDDVLAVLERWDLTVDAVREQVYRAPTPRERERWHALWLLAGGWSAGQVANALGRDPHTIGEWLAALRQAGPVGLSFEHTGGSPPALNRQQQAELKAAIQAPPAAVGSDRAAWNGKGVREVVQRRFGRTLRRSSWLTYLHRLGFVLKRPKKRLIKADAERRATFVREYALLRSAAQANGAKLLFADEAHLYADVDLRGKWVLRGEPALVDSTSPRWGEKGSYSSAVCLETGEVEARELEGNSTAETSVAFLQQLRAHHSEPLIVIWDNRPAHSGDALRAYLTTPGLHLRLVRLPAYSPDFNPDEAIWGWVRAEVTANTCFGTRARVRDKVGAFFGGLTDRTEEVKRRCRTILQTKAETFTAEVHAILQSPTHVDPTLALL